jgi:hypothetical protein
MLFSLSSVVAGSNNDDASRVVSLEGAVEVMLSSLRRDELQGKPLILVFGQWLHFGICFAHEDFVGIVL